METVTAQPGSGQVNGGTAWSAPAALSRLLDLALWITAAGIVAGWLALLALHISDDYRMTHTHGVWIAAAESAREGRLYAPIFDGTHYAGTRYMPIPILVNAAASAAAGDPLAGGKAAGAVMMGILIVLVVVVLRQQSCPWGIAAALAATIVATDTGLLAGTTIGGDAVPAVLQLGALAVALASGRQRSLVIAGVLAGLAVASKLTGLWGFLAIVSWLAAQRRWRAAATFAAASVTTGTVVLAAVQLATAGGLLRHLLAFSAAGLQGGPSLLRAPNQLLYQLTTHASGAVVLLPLAAVGAILSRGRPRQSIVYLALGYALLLLLIVYSDVGTGSNQLLDLVLLIALAVGVLAGRAATSGEPATARVVLLAVVVSVLCGASIDMIRTVGRDLRLSVAAMRAGEDATPIGQLVSAMVRPGETVLAADPSIDVALGRRPLVMDPFMLVRLDRARPEWVDPLIASIEQQRFDVVVMVVRLENPAVDFWWTDYHFGPRVARALRASYRYEGEVGRYHLYRPIR